MSAKSDYLEDAILNHVLRNVSLTSPTTVYCALFTVAPTDSGGGTEVSGGSYARTAITFGAPSGGVVSNSAAVTFPTATAGWGTVVAFAIFDLVAGGNMLYYGNLTVSKVVLTNDVFEFLTGQLSVTEL